MVAQAEYRLEAQSESADLVSSFRAEVGMRDSIHSAQVEGCALIRAIENTAYKNDFDAAVAIAFQHRVCGVLNELRDLTVRIPAGSKRFFLSEVFDQQLGIGFVRAQGCAELVLDLLFEESIRCRPDCHRRTFRNLTRGVMPRLSVDCGSGPFEHSAAYLILPNGREP